MAGKIPGIITKRAFEYIAPRLAELLFDELSWQEYIDEDFEITVPEIFVERRDPLNHTETLAINISLAQGNYDNKNQGNSDGTYIWNIDVFGKAKATDTEDGDKISALNVQKLYGYIWSILENPVYNTLGFQRPFISRTLVQAIDIAEMPQKDALSNYMMRCQFMVKLNESAILKEPLLVAGYQTKVKISNTNKGYLWIGETYD